MRSLISAVWVIAVAAPAAAWAADPLVISSVDIVAPANPSAAPKYGKVELLVALTGGTFTKVYDPRPSASASGLDLRATFTGPDASQWDVCGYYDGTSWRVRFAPTVTGNWTYSVSAQDNSSAFSWAGGSFTCVASPAPGFVRIDGNHLRFSNGTAFYGIGVNNGWQYDVEQPAFATLAAKGINLMSFWMNTPDTIGSQQPDPTGAHRRAPIENITQGIGVYNQSACTYLDGVIARAEDAGVYLLPTVWTHGNLNNGTPDWDADWWWNLAYSDPRICSSPTEFFKTTDGSNDTAQWAYQKNFYRYVLARWGYSRAIVAWVSLCETEGTTGYAGTGANPSQATAWCGAVRDYFASNDPYRLSGGNYPAAVSKSDWQSDAATWSNNCNMAAVDSYTEQKNNVEIANAIATQTTNMRGTGRPAFHSEFGGEVGAGATEPAHMHNGIWAGTAAGACLAPLKWCDGGSWPLLTDGVYGAKLQDNLSFLSQFISGIDYIGAPGYTAASVTVPLSTSRGWGMRVDDRGFAWIQNKNGNMGGQVVAISTLTPGCYEVVWYDTWKSAAEQTFTSSCATVGGDGVLYLIVPALAQNDIAVKFVCRGIKDINGNGLIINSWGSVSVTVVAPETNDYYVQVWDSNMISPPKWAWASVNTAAQTINAGATCTFTLYPKPDSSSQAFDFFLYKKDIFGFGQIIDKVQTTLNALPQVATPTISPNGGTFANSVQVTLTPGTTGASIRYTTDGTTPSSTAGTLYVNGTPFTLTASATFNAIAYMSGMADSAVASANFTIQTTAAVVTSVALSSGPPAGNTNVTITGYNFTGATSVKFGGVAATNVTVSSDTQITCTTPAHSAGFVDVFVTTPQGTGTLANGFFYDGSTWHAAGSLATARRLHTATLLASGKVLVAGGCNNNLSLASAELYDPGTNTWSAAGSLATARCLHTATLLAGGKVLVAGGSANGGGNLELASAELYDPGTNTWSAAGSLATARCVHTATLLASGQVLVSGGYNWNGTRYVSLASAELYDPEANTWGELPSMAYARDHHTATLLPSGKVLVAGGSPNGIGIPLLASAELYDPGTNTWNAAGALATARDTHTATLLPSGKVLVAGGRGSGGVTLATSELYDPGANTWGAANNLATARYQHTATLLPCGNVLVADGYCSGFGFLASAEMYDPRSSMWCASGTLSTARGLHTATVLPSSKVLVAAGVAGDTFQSAEIYDYGGGAFQHSWRPVINTVTSPLAPGAKLALYGSRFKGISEASGGDYQNSATNYPLVQLHSLVNDQTEFLLSDPGSNWSDTSFTSAPVNNFPPGPAQVTVFTNGIPSLPKSLTVTPAMGAASTLVVSGFPSPTTAGTAGNFAVTAKDGSGNTATGYTGTVHFTSSDGAAVLPGDYTFVGGDNGSHSFSATLKTTGTQSITATDTSTGSINGTQSSITVNPATPARLAFTTQPSGGTGGTVFGTQPVVTVKDNSGNKVASASNIITLAMGTNPGGGTLSADANRLAASSGAASFSGVKIDKAGSGYTLRASASGLTSATSGTFDVTLGPLAKFDLVLSSSQANGSAFTGANTLTAQDAGGNTVTTFDASVDNVRIVANAPLVGNVAGLGTGINNVLNRATDFVSGVADLTALGMIYGGGLGTGTFTATSSTGATGTSGNVTINGSGPGQPGKEMQVVTWLTIPASVSIAWGAGTTGKTAGDVTPFDWTVQDATGGQLAASETCVSNDAHNNLAMILENTTNTGTKARVNAAVASTGGWTIAAVPATDTFVIQAQVGTNTLAALTAAAQELTGTTRLAKGADQPLVVTVLTPTAITQYAGVQKTILVVLTATPE